MCHGNVCFKNDLSNWFGIEEWAKQNRRDWDDGLYWSDSAVYHSSNRMRNIHIQLFLLDNHNHCLFFFFFSNKGKNGKKPTQIAYMTKWPNYFFILIRWQTVGHLCNNTIYFLEQHQDIMLEQVTERWSLSKIASSLAQTVWGWLKEIRLKYSLAISDYSTHYTHHVLSRVFCTDHNIAVFWKAITRRLIVWSSNFLTVVLFVHKDCAGRKYNSVLEKMWQTGDLGEHSRQGGIC